MGVEVLSLGKSDTKCSKERWVEVFKNYSPQARYHASTLAAHNWDVLLIDGAILLVSYYGGGHWIPISFGLENKALPQATGEQLSALYDTSVHPKTRLFLSEPRP